MSIFVLVLVFFLTKGPVLTQAVTAESELDCKAAGLSIYNDSLGKDIEGAGKKFHVEDIEIVGCIKVSESI